MIEVTIHQLREKLPAILGAGASTLVLGNAGTGKTKNSSDIVRIIGPTVVVNGARESHWKSMFPYRMPNGRISVGTAMAACGWEVKDNGELVQNSKARATMVIDEVNRCPADRKGEFQLLASERSVQLPESTDEIKLSIGFVGTANHEDLGVEEMAAAELDRWDICLWLKPTPDEIEQIMCKTLAPADAVRIMEIYERARNAPLLTPEAARIVREHVDLLATKLKPSADQLAKFHQPQGIRLAESIARLLPLNLFSVAMVFRATAERCFPLGRRGAERYRREFNGIVTDIGAQLASKLGGLPMFQKQTSAQPSTTQAAPAGATVAATAAALTADSLEELRLRLNELQGNKVTTSTVPLPRRAMQMLKPIGQAFGGGVSLHLMRNPSAGAAERNGVRVDFGKDGDKVRFTDVDRPAVVKFLELVLGPAPAEPTTAPDAAPAPAPTA
jgi:hypothetical protein